MILSRSTKPQNIRFEVYAISEYRISRCIIILHQINHIIYAKNITKKQITENFELVDYVKFCKIAF